VSVCQCPSAIIKPHGSSISGEARRSAGRCSRCVTHAQPASPLLSRSTVALAALATFGYALYDDYQIDGDGLPTWTSARQPARAPLGGVVRLLAPPMYPGRLGLALGHTLFPGNTCYQELRALLSGQLRDFSAGDVAVVVFYGRAGGVEGSQRVSESGGSASHGSVSAGSLIPNAVSRGWRCW